MREQGVTQHNLKLNVKLGEPLHIGPKVLTMGTGVLDPDHLNLDAIRINSVDVHGHSKPVGISFSAGSPSDGKLLPTTHRETYVSSDMDAMGEPACMHHAIAHAGSTFHEHTLQLVPDSTRGDLHEKADARLMRWANTNASDIGTHMNYTGVKSMKNDVTGDIKHLLPMGANATDPIPKFFDQNQTSGFLGGAYQKSKQKTVEVNNQPMLVVTDEHIKAAADVLGTHLTPQTSLAKGMTVTATPLDGHPAACGSHAVVSVSLLRTPVTDAPSSAQGEAAMTYSAGADNDTSALHAQVFGSA